MKEIIVIDFKDLKCAEDKNYVIAKKEKCKVEKYPTNWEELKTMCEDLESKNVFIINAGNCIEFNGLYFWKDGSITITQNNNDIWAIKTNLTSARQWQIIKSLIGEE